MRAREGGFADAVGTSITSSFGRYRGAPEAEAAPTIDLQEVWDVPARTDVDSSEPELQP